MLPAAYRPTRGVWWSWRINARLRNTGRRLLVSNQMRLALQSAATTILVVAAYLSADLEFPI